MRGMLFSLLFVLGTTISIAQEPTNEPAAQTNSTKKNESSDSASPRNGNSHADIRSSNAWKWILGIVLTAIISPIIVKVVEKRLGRDPIKEKSQRLQTVIDLQTARKTQGLPPDGRLSALVNELTDALGDEAKGTEQAIDEATSFIVGTLSSRLLESLLSSCRYIELLMDSKHRSDAMAAIFDLTRLEFLRSYYGQRRIGVPSQFTSISEDDLSKYAHECEQQGDSLGSKAIQFANAIGSTPDDVRNFVGQLQMEIRKIAERDAEEGGTDAFNS